MSGTMFGASMAFETTVTVPTRHVHELMTRLARSGFLVLDTGDRVSTEDGVGAEAQLRLLHVTPDELDAAEALGVTA